MISDWYLCWSICNKGKQYILIVLSFLFSVFVPGRSWLLNSWCWCQLHDIDSIASTTFFIEWISISRFLPLTSFSCLIFFSWIPTLSLSLVPETAAPVTWFPCPNSFMSFSYVSLVFFIFVTWIINRLFPLLTTERVVEEAVSGIRLDKDVIMIPSFFNVLIAVKAMVSKEADIVFANKVLRLLTSMQTFSGKGGGIQEKAKPPTTSFSPNRQ